MPDDMREQLTKYLTDAHSIEEQAIAQLADAPEAAGEPQLAAALREHLEETKGHEQAVRRLLEGRDESPSTFKDLVMKLGGKGFVLFAQAQPDTPGKLLSHALSYEALEYASYDLLARTAKRGGEHEVAREAERIRDEERRMMERLEGLVDATAQASMRDVPRDDMEEQLRKYLADAHALESQAIQMLEAAPGMVEDETLAAVFEDHLAESRDHAELVEARLKALGGDPSGLKDAVMRAGALQWGGFFQGHPDTPGKLTAFAYAFEHLEIGGYEQLKRVARHVGDEETAALADRILADERTAATRLAGAFDRAVQAALAAQGIGS